ncbi:MAG: CoB--CoM heterodisulfide reductase iron-sulfur subunit A family protein [Thermoplasmata archaeon]|nr:MAG: CoB--CoM heterodisulfide reductase iron-sulfur subunit A family protein [Thermoplasmata archaeon]
MRGIKSKEPETGVIFCSCNDSIGKNIDFDELEKDISKRPNVVFVKRHDRLCTKEGQQFLKGEVKGSGVKRVVLAACTPRTYEETLRKGVVKAGLNSYLIEHVNLREQCDWIHDNRDAATRKANIMILGGIGRVLFAQSIKEKNMSLKNSTHALVIGGGIAGMTAASEFSKKGIHVYLVEKSDKLGGRAYELDDKRLSEFENITLPTIEGLTGNENIEVLLNSEVTSILGALGNYSVIIKSQDEEKEVNVGGIVIATGSSLFDAKRLPEYRYEDPDVIDFLELEKMLKDNTVSVPSTGDVPKRINFIQCVGSRDENRGNAHCSLVCCTYALKQAQKIKSQYPEIDVYIHYMDLRGPDNGFEEIYLDAQKIGVKFMRGRCAEIQRKEKDLVLRTEHIELGDILEMRSDLVVLATGQEAQKGTSELADMVHLVLDVDGFLGYYNDRYDILDRRGVSIAGCAEGPMGIKKSISDAKKSVREILDVFTNGVKVKVVHSVIDEPRCVGCRICEKLCPYDAISMKVVKNYYTGEEKLISSVDLTTCQGCGACAMACPGGVPSLVGYSNPEILAQIDEVC